MHTQGKIDGILQRRALEMAEVEAKYHEMLKHEYLVRSIEVKKLQNFWLNCLKNHHTLPGIITQNDWKLLESLEDLTLDEFTSRNKVKTYKLTLEFKPNDLISNNSIWAAVNNDEVQSYTASGIDFKTGFGLEQLEEGEEKESFFRMFLSSDGKGLINNSGFVFDIVFGIKIDLWEDPVKYYSDSM